MLQSKIRKQVRNQNHQNESPVHHLLPHHHQILRKRKSLSNLNLNHLNNLKLNSLQSRIKRNHHLHPLHLLILRKRKSQHQRRQKTSKRKKKRQKLKNKKHNQNKSKVKTKIILKRLGLIKRKKFPLLLHHLLILRKKIKSQHQRKHKI